ncbi:MAG: exo-poly-alpha-D-galacturonosidase, partial [Kluyvera intermedia]
VFRNNAMKDLAKEPFIFTIKYSADVNDTTPATEPAQFRNVTVQDVTIDGTVAKKSILVDGMTVQEMTAAYGITYPRDAYHQNLMFTNVKFRNVQASNITFLHDSQFTNVTFENTDKAWNFAQVSGITLSDSVNNEVISATGKETVVRDAATK